MATKPEEERWVLTRAERRSYDDAGRLVELEAYDGDGNLLDRLVRTSGPHPAHPASRPRGVPYVAVHDLDPRERRETVTMLRGACADYGDNDWPDDLWLPDVIEKHLLRHLDAEGPLSRPPTSPAAADPPPAPGEPPER